VVPPARTPPLLAVPVSAGRFMSIVTIQVGQCGNQVGGALFAKLAEEADAGPDDFRRATQEARAAVLGSPPRLLTARA